MLVVEDCDNYDRRCSGRYFFNFIGGRVVGRKDIVDDKVDCQNAEDETAAQLV